jgi:hypothetical protein
MTFPSSRARLTSIVAVVVVLVSSLIASVPIAHASGLADGAYLYVAQGSALHVYRFGTWDEVATFSLPQLSDGVRGVAMDPTLGALFIAHGGDGGPNGNGSLLKWDVATGTTSWDMAYPFGTDQLAACGGRVYMPTGEAATGSTWEVLSGADGSVLSTLAGGARPHNTICDAGHVFMGGRQARYLFMKVLPSGARMKVGPSPSVKTGVRPFTVNADDTRAYITWTKYRGFSVADLTTGAILASENFGPVPSGFRPTSPSHGISLSPDGTEVYVMDAPARQVEVWTAGDAPTHLATINVWLGFAMPLRLPQRGLAPAQPRRSVRVRQRLRGRDRHHHANGRGLDRNARERPSWVDRDRLVGRSASGDVIALRDRPLAQTESPKSCSSGEPLPLTCASVWH